MDKHVKLLGIFNIIFGSLGLAVAIGIVVWAGGFGAVQTSFGDDTAGLAALILVVFQMIVSVPCIIAGFGILRYHDWARIMLTIVSALNMLNIPIGSTLGSYGLWVLISEETEPLFAHPPARFRKKAQAAKAAAAGVKPAESSQKSTSILPSDT
jgi:hypothetical protein